MTRAVFLVLLALLPGCAWLERPRALPFLAEESSAEQMVAYLAELQAMRPSALAVEAARGRRASPQASALARVKTAMAVFVANPGEDAEVVALLAPVVKGEIGNRDLHAMASFLQGIAAERRRLRESAAARVRDERRVLEQLRSRADAAQERAEQLQQKLDALTQLEKSLSDRQVQGR